MTAARRLYLDTNLQILFSITLIAVMGVTTISPSFPEMSRALNLKPKEAGLMIAFFTMPGILLAPLLGMMSDRIGRKKILIPSLFIFVE